MESKQFRILDKRTDIPFDAWDVTSAEDLRGDGDMKGTPKAMRELRGELVDAMEEAHRDDEDEIFDAAEAGIRSLDRQIKIAEVGDGVRGVDDIEEGDDQPDVRVGQEPADKAAGREDGGFSNHRDFILTVKQTCQRGRIEDDRLEKRATGSDEQSTFSDPYGGFTIPTAFEPDMFSLEPAEDEAADRVTRLPMDQPTVKFPARVDKDHSNSVTGGFQVYRRAEADTVQPSRMQVEQIQYNAEPLMGLAYATEELLTDSPSSFAAMIEQGFEDEFTSKLIEERFHGTGAGQFAGVLNAACTLGEDRDSSNEISGNDVIQMRMQAYRYGQCIWMANQDTYKQLLTAHVSLTNEDIAVFSPADSADGQSMVWGRPVYFNEYLPSLGTTGDLVLCNWSEYLEGLYQQPETESSIHVRFDTNERAFRMVARNDGAPWWSSSLTPKRGDNNLSPFVVLNA